MASLTISAAARLCHMDRRTLQRAIHAGRLHLDAQHCLSTDELLLAGYLIAETPQDAPQATPQFTPQDPVLAQILGWREDGMTLRAIAARLNAEGVPTRSGQGKWYPSNLSRELRRVGRGR